MKQYPTTFPIIYARRYMRVSPPLELYIAEANILNAARESN